MENLDCESLLRLHSLIEKSSCVCVVSHVHPDGDAVGSSLALSTYLVSLGKSVTTLFPDSVPDTLSFISEESDRILTAAENPDDAEAALSSCDTLFVLDMNSFQRSDVLCGVLSSLRCPKVLIDHHLNPDADSFDLVFSRTAVSSASELLFWILMSLPDIEGNAGKLPAHTLRALMCGMTTDTNNFANSVFPSTLRMASLLIEAGVDRDEIISSIYNNYREERLRLLGYLLSEKMTITPQGVSYMILDKSEMERFDIKEGDTEAFVNFPLGLAKVKMSIFLKEYDGLYRVSIRSKRGISSNRLACRYFNGGGHFLASGGKLFIGSDIADAASAAAYIESCTEQFFKDENY